MIHIVFQENDIDTLKKAIGLDESLEGDVIQIKDDFAVGPLKDIYSKEGIEERKQWWRRCWQAETMMESLIMVPLLTTIKLSTH